MADEKSLEKLKSMRNLLKNEMDKSDAFSSALQRTGSRLEEINHKLVCFETDAKRERWRFSSFSDSIAHVTAPVAAVLRVYASVSDLEKSLLSSDSCSCLLSYILNVKRLGELMGFLSDSCILAVNWLEETIVFLVENGMPEDHPCVLRFKKPLGRLRELQKIKANAHCSGGVLAMALEELETEFKRILEDEYTVPSPEQACQGEVSAVTNLRKLRALIETVSVHKRLKSCVSIYAKVRTTVVQKRFEALGTDYLAKTITEFDNVQDIEGHIDQWKRDMEMAVRDVYDFEWRLCYQVFENAGDDVSSRSFGQIAANSGIIDLLRFGMRITECKNDPSKLLKLLDAFSTMDKIRLEFNRLFGGETCSEIRKVTRELIRRLVNCASIIFWELPYQVELQRSNSPPLDGSVPRLVRFVTEYCNELLGDYYKPILTKILEIDFSWKHATYREELLTSHIYNVLREMALNLDTWSRSFNDAVLSYIFMMNNHSHFCGLKETHLGKMMGESWLRAHEQYRDYYAVLYVKETWGTLMPLLKYKAQAFAASPVKRKRARESVKRTLQAFTETFDEIYMKQSNWVIEDEALRWKICQVATQTIVPTYQSYLQNSMMFLMEEDHPNPGKYINYTSQGLETKLKNMFQNKRTKSSKHSHFVHKVMDSEIRKHTHLTLAAI